MRPPRTCSKAPFAKLYLSWDRVRDRGALDGYVRRIMVTEHNSPFTVTDVRHRAGRLKRDAGSPPVPPSPLSSPSPCQGDVPGGRAMDGPAQRT